MVYVVGNIVQRALALLLLPVLTRVLSVDEFGLASTATALLLLLSTIYGLGLSFSIVRSYYDAQPTGPAGWAALIRVQAVVSLVLMLITLATGSVWAQALGDIGWARALQAAVVTAWITGLLTTVQAVLRAAQRPGAFFAVLMVQLVLGSAVGITMAHYWDAAGYIVGMGIGATAALATGALFVRRRPLWRMESISSGIRMALPAMLHQLSSWGLDFADRLIIAAYLTTAAVGRYQVAYIAGSAITMLLTSMQQAWTPHYLQMSDASRRSLPGQLLMSLVVLSLCAAALVVLFTPVLLALVLPRAYTGLNTITALVAATVMPRAAYHIGTAILLDRRRTGAMARASGIGVVANIGANVILIPTLGLAAAGAATFGAVALTCILVLVPAQRLIATRFQIARLAAVWLIGAAALVSLAQIPPDADWALARTAAALVAVAAGVHVGQRLRSTISSRASAESHRAPAELIDP